jgi:hypothetical protein
MRFYSMSDVAWAQVQAAGASVQIGGRIWGVEPKADWRSYEGWGPICLRLMTPDYECGMRTLFELRLGRVLVRWKSRGQTVPGHYKYDESGWTMKLFKKRVPHFARQSGSASR